VELKSVSNCNIMLDRSGMMVHYHAHEQVAFRKARPDQAQKGRQGRKETLPGMRQGFLTRVAPRLFALEPRGGARVLPFKKDIGAHVEGH
jgi:hypothetical protein